MSNDDVHAKLAGINERLNYLNDEVTSIKSILRNHEKRAVSYTHLTLPTN